VDGNIETNLKKNLTGFTWVRTGPHEHSYEPLGCRTAKNLTFSAVTGL
jgi:hypothetical protein